MRFLLLLFLALASGFALTVFVDNPGYVLITREPWAIETSLTVFALGILFTFTALYLLVRLSNNLLKTPANLRRWQNHRNVEQAVLDTSKGLSAAINGNWSSAEKHFNKKLEHSPQPEINLLSAAWVAQQENDLQKRDDLLAATSQLENLSDDAKKAAAQIKLILLQQADETEQALATARMLFKQSPTSPTTINSLIQLLKDTKHWQDLLTTLNSSSKHANLSERQTEKLYSLAATELLSSIDNYPELLKCWKNLSKSARKQPAIISAYCNQLQRFEHQQDAESTLRAGLKEQWSDELISLYGQIKANDPASQLKYAESFLTKRPTNSALMLCMGRLAILNQLWGMAHSFLELAVQNADSQEAFLELAWLLDSMNEKEKAIKVYRAGLERSLNSGTINYSVPSSSQVEVYEGENIIPDAVSVANNAKNEQNNAGEQKNQTPSLAYSNESK